MIKTAAARLNDQVKLLTGHGHRARTIDDLDGLERYYPGICNEIHAVIVAWLSEEDETDV